MRDFGELKKVPLCEMWARESTDFSPWLADNIGALGKTLGMDLEIQGQEAGVGDFALDILAKDVGSNRTVIIENQLTSTDHDHLGKLITYASGFDASVVVWLAEMIREEHRQALDWLNQRTNSETQFFGVIIEVLQIDESRPAYNFKPIVFPNEWRKGRRPPGSGQISSRGEAYQKFFQALIDELREQHSFTGARRGQPQNWYYFSSGIQGFYYEASLAQGGRARIGVYIDVGDRDENKKMYDHLEQDRSAVENEFGGVLEWDRLDGYQASRIATYRSGSIELTERELEQLGTWMVEKLLLVKKVLAPRMAKYAEAVELE